MTFKEEKTSDAKKGSKSAHPNVRSPLSEDISVNELAGRYHMNTYYVTDVWCSALIRCQKRINIDTWTVIM